MKRPFLFTAILLLLFIEIANASENGHVFGYVNVAKCVMFHPLMAKYRINEGRFSPEALPGKASLKSGHLAEEHAEILSRQKKIQEEIQKSAQEFSQTLIKLRAPKNGISASQTGDNADYEYNQKKHQLEKAFLGKRMELQSKLSEIEQEFTRLVQENSMALLITQEETDKVFSSMLDEIYAAIEGVSKHYKVDFVFNSSLSVERVPVNPSFTPVNPMHDFFSLKFDRDARDVLFQHGSYGTPPIVMQLDYWCACQGYVFKNMAETGVDKMFLKGGLDMTPAVIDLVYKNRNISQQHREMMQEYLKLQH